MGVHVDVSVSESWKFFNNNKDRLAKEMILIAENTDTEYAIYLSEENGCPQFSVCRGEAKPEYEELAINEAECISIYKKLCVRYLFPVIEDESEKFDRQSNDSDDEDMETIACERDCDLTNALCEFLLVVLELKDNSDAVDTITNLYGQEFLEESLDYFLEYISSATGESIFRPVLITDEETGEEKFEPFPYDIIDEDEDEDDCSDYDFDDDELAFDDDEDNEVCNVH